MKTVFFDFDGTLSYKSPNAWREIDKISVAKNPGNRENYQKYLQMFLTEKIDYKEWCKIVADGLRVGKFNKVELDSITKMMHTIPNMEESFKTLKHYGYNIQIVSGGIEDVIKKTLGTAMKFVDKINSNKIEFDEKGNFKDIIATDYDYKGKADCISKYMQETQSKPEEIVFVGNSSNDEYVYTTGVKTICINPDGADYKNTKKWNKCFEIADSLNIVLPEIIGKDYTNKKHSVGLVCGSFDPFTLGHLALIKEACNEFDYVYIAISKNLLKRRRRFDAKLMQQGIQNTIKESGIKNCECVIKNGIPAIMAKELGCTHLFRGIRDEKDMIYEERFAKINNLFNMPTIFYMNDNKISSTEFRQAMSQGKDISRYLPKGMQNYVKYIEGRKL